jgi:hypothetical protein
MIANHETLEKIKENAISLEKFGVNDLAWEKDDAFRVVSSIMNDRIGILGGDVYKLSSEYLEPLCDNWACEREKGEADEEYYLRSKQKTLNYIESYPVLPEENIVFSITFTEQIAI